MSSVWKRNETTVDRIANPWFFESRRSLDLAQDKSVFYDRQRISRSPSHAFAVDFVLLALWAGGGKEVYWLDEVVLVRWSRSPSSRLSIAGERQELVQAVLGEMKKPAQPGRGGVISSPGGTPLLTVLIFIPADRGCSRQMRTELEVSNAKNIFESKDGTL
jgi:hypothetical protein